MAQPLTAEEAYRACEDDIREAQAIARSRPGDEFDRIFKIEFTRRYARRVDSGEILLTIGKGVS